MFAVALTDASNVGTISLPEFEAFAGMLHDVRDLRISL
eukprot:SAG31_NODE_15134_length_768_cov_1.908819_1_plen_37_part_10